MSQDDLDLKEGIKGDGEKFKLIYDKLWVHAKYHASEQFSDYNLSCEIAEKAIDKAVEWLRTDNALKVDYPMAFVKRVIENSIIDTARTRKLEGLPLNTIKGDLAQIDEKYSAIEPSSDDEDISDASQLSGWHGIEIKQALIEENPPELIEHTWLRIINDLPGHTGWLRGISFCGKKMPFEARKDYPKILYLEYKQRWQQYELVASLIESIPSLAEKTIIELYLHGYEKQKDIADKLGVTKSRVSQVINKWMGLWNWDDIQLGKYRIIILTYTLASIYERIHKVAIVKTVPNYFRSKYRWELGLSVNQQQKFENSIRNKLYEEVTSAPQISRYFFNLKKSDNQDLIKVCNLCYEFWYDLNKIAEDEPLFEDSYD